MFNKTVHFCRKSLMLQKNSRHFLGNGIRSYAQVVDANTSSDSNIDLLRSRLIYQSRKRGILENCIIFTTFSDKYLKTFDSAQLQKYDALINSQHNEWDLYAWAIGSKPAPQEFDNDVMSLIKSHVHRQDHNIQ